MTLANGARVLGFRPGRLCGVALSLARAEAPRYGCGMFWLWRGPMELVQGLIELWRWFRERAEPALTAWGALGRREAA